MRLLITSHVIHYSHAGRLYAYGPYAREIDLWAELFHEVRIASPCRLAPPPGDCLPFERRNITMISQKEAGGETLAAKLGLIASVPGMALGLARAMRQADAIHVRCPGNLGLIGVVLAPLFSRRVIAKYAAQWDGGNGEPFSARVQRAILRSWWWKGPVTVYGTWPGSPKHVIPFFTSILDAEQLERAKASAERPRRGPGLRVLYTGRLSRPKNVDVLLRATALAGPDVSATIVGEGSERASLEALADSLGIRRRVTFTGGLPFDNVIEHLESSDVMVLVSEAEGWGKSLAEGMAFGLACIGAGTTVVSQMLGEGRGFTVAPRDEFALAAVLRRIAASPDRLEAMRQSASAWAQRLSLEGLRDALRALMCHWWPGATLLLPPAPDPRPLSLASGPLERSTS